MWGKFQTKYSLFSLRGVIYLSLIAFLIAVLSPLLLIIAIFLFFLILHLIPTAFNLLITGYFVWNLKKLTNNIFFLVPVFVIVSFFLAMNVRIIDVISDITTQNPSKYEKNKKISLPYGSPISLNTTIDKIYYKKIRLPAHLQEGMRVVCAFTSITQR